MRRILDFPDRYADARRIVLETNYRCPPAVVAAAGRLIAVNRERVPKRIRAATSPKAAEGYRPASPPITTWPLRGPDAMDELAYAISRMPPADERLAVLTRTRAELAPLALALLRAGVPHTTSIPTPLDAEPVHALLADLAADPSAAPLAALLAARARRGWRRADENDRLGEDDHAALDAAIGWAVGHRRTDAYLAAFADARARLASLRIPDGAIELTTVHGAKGREWPTVVVLGMDVDRFPNRRAVVEAADPSRAIEEERRLAYVAVTRCRWRLILAFDPNRPSPFVAELQGAASRPFQPAAYRPTSGATTVR